MSKRLFDLFFASIGLIIICPLLIILYVIATIDTKQNGIFFQKRIGQFGLPFTIYKIRTFGISKKHPISKLGRFLRNSKLDELPQLFNIIIGNMSFVGPRPDIEGYYDLLEGENRKILELKLGEELSLNEICKELNRLKILTPTNKEWDKPKLSSYYKTLKSDVGK